MPKVSDAPERILQYMSEFSELYGFAPSVREICHAVGIRSTSTVHHHMERLMEQGVLHKTVSGSARCFSINHTVKMKEEPKHLCLQTSDGGRLILDFITHNGRVVFNGLINMSGLHNGEARVISCHELDEDAYYEAITGQGRTQSREYQKTSAAG